MNILLFLLLLGVPNTSDWLTEGVPAATSNRSLDRPTSPKADRDPETTDSGPEAGL